MIAHAPRHADPAWLGLGFEPHGDVHSIANDVAHIDADAQHQTIVWLELAVSSVRSCWIWTAQFTAEITLPNSARIESPAVNRAGLIGGSNS